MCYCEKYVDNNLQSIVKLHIPYKLVNFDEIHNFSLLQLLVPNSSPTFFF